MPMPKLIASASPTDTFVNSKFLKEQCPPALAVEDEDLDLFVKSVDAVTGEGAAVNDQNQNPNS